MEVGVRHQIIVAYTSPFTFLFTGAYQKLEVSAKDFVTKQIIPGKMVTKYRYVRRYDVTDQDNPSEVSIWERGQVLYWLAREKTELTIMRNGAPNSQKTTYNMREKSINYC